MGVDRTLTRVGEPGGPGGLPPVRIAPQNFLGEVWNAQHDCLAIADCDMTFRKLLTDGTSTGRLKEKLPRDPNVAVYSSKERSD